MLIKKIFLGISLLLKASIGLALVLSVLGFIYLFSTYGSNAAGDLLLYFVLGVISVAGLLKGLIAFFDWLGQPSEDDEYD